MSLRSENVLQQTSAQPTDYYINNQLTFNLQKITAKRFNYQTFLWLHGIDINGYSVAIQLTDYKPTILVMAPESWDDVDEEALEELQSYVADIESSRMESQYYKSNGDETNWIHDARFRYMSPFIGFTNNRQDRLIEITCSSIATRSKVVKYLESKLQVLYHKDFKDSNQLLQQTNWSMQDWFTVDTFTTHVNPFSHANIECSCRVQDLTPDEKGPTYVPRILKSFVRVFAMSQDGVVDNKHHSYQPNPLLPCDRILCLGLTLTWSHHEEKAPFCEYIFSCIPEDRFQQIRDQNDHHHPNLQYVFCDHERDLLVKFRKKFIAWDPDDVYYFPDTLDTLSYIATRAVNTGKKTTLKLERFKNNQLVFFKDANGHLTRTKINTRTVFNMEAALKKKVFISVEKYDLYTCSSHKKLRKNPTKRKHLMSRRHWVNEHIAKGPEGQGKILLKMLQDLRLLFLLEHDMSMRLEFANVSRASDTDLTDVVSRGEQIRVFNKLTHFCMDNNKYVNKSKLASKPLKFSIRERPPTYKDPAELKINVALRETCYEELQEKKARHAKKKVKLKHCYNSFQDVCPQSNVLKIRNNCIVDSFSDDDDDSDNSDQEEEEEMKEGGNVVKPSPRFWGDTRIFVFDFKSLYPSIMMAYNLSYENLVYDQKYLDLPGVTYITIPINKYETVVTANLPGLIPKMLRMLVDARDMIKKKMKVETDPFRKKVYDFEQNSMKVLCNATYGFCGAEKRGAMLAVKTIMYMVTALGRYLQKECSRYLGHKYGIPTIYGDTDSIFVLLPIFKEQQEHLYTMETLCQETGQMYDMKTFKPFQNDHLPFTWSNVVAHYAGRKYPLAVNEFQNKQHQINAIMYLVSEKLCDELTSLFPHPVIMEFENMCDRCIMTWKKKTYCYRFYKESDPSKIKYDKVTGMPVKKRDWTPWTRSVLQGVQDRILYNKTHEILNYLNEEVNKLLTGQVPIEQLMISKSIKEKEKYKSFKSAHLQVMKKLEKRNRWPVKSNSRVYFVIVEGEEKLYLRSETPDYVVEHKLPLDVSYYMNKQFYKPMKKLLTFHPELFDFDKQFSIWKAKLTRIKNNGVATMKDLTKKKRTSIQAFIASKQKKKRRKLTHHNTRKTTTLQPTNPFFTQFTTRRLDLT